MDVAFSPLRVENLFVAYGKADVICGVNMEVCAGRITGLLGANGAGKTTLLRAILGLTPPRKGSVLFNGMEITGLPPHKIAARGISCIPEGRRIFSKMTVEENLLMGAYMEKDGDKIRQRLERVYRIFPRLLERREQFAGTMSGGEQAMVSIGRGLMNEPKLLIIDEPSLGRPPRWSTTTSASYGRFAKTALPCSWSSRTCGRPWP